MSNSSILLVTRSKKYLSWVIINREPLNLFKYSSNQSIVSLSKWLVGSSNINNSHGVINAEAYKLDFSKIEPYFTERAINYIKTEFTDTPYAHKDGNYYIFASENKYSHSKKEFISTIFGVTDQGKRTFDVKLYDDNMIVAISEKSSFFELDEYIVLRKINNTWKIDMFEEL